MGNPDTSPTSHDGGFLGQQVQQAVRQAHLRHLVIFRKRQNSKTLESLIEEFANELISQRLRAQLEEDTRAVRERIVAQAFSEADL